MQKSEIQVGQEYVLREGKDPNAPFQRIKIIQHVRGKKWKAEWIDPNPGLVDYIEIHNLIIRWWAKRIPSGGQWKELNENPMPS